MAKSPLSIPLNNGPAGSAGGPVTSVRDTLMLEAGITPAIQAEAVKEAWEVKRSLLNARKVQYFSFEGQVTDEREVNDNGVRLQAADAIDRFVGAVAPKATQKVEHVYRVELPDWAVPDNAPSQVIDVTAVEVEKVV